MKFAEDSKNLIASKVRRSDQAIKSARANLALELYDDAASRFYYGLFHLASAALSIEGIKTKTHKGVIGKFSQTFIHSGVFDKQLADTLQRLQNMRNNADYEPLREYTLSDLEPVLEEIELFQDTLKIWLEEKVREL